MTANRRLDIEVTFNCTHNAAEGSFGGGATYRQTGSMPDMGSVVDADGSIHLDRAASFDSSVFNNNVDVYLTLVSPANVSPDNTTTPIAWATQYGQGVTLHPPEGGGTAGEFSVETVPGNPNQILIRDKDDDSNTYRYKPAVELLEHGHYYISLDPPIVNRPPAR